MPQYAGLFEIEKERRWSGVYYQGMAMDWLANFDVHASEIEAVLRELHASNTASGCAAGAGSPSRHQAC